MSVSTWYEPKKFKLSGLHGISDATLELHFKLYEGYVQGTNILMEKLAGFLQDGKVDQEEMPAYSELTRRLGFEYNGMVLHEYYFGNLKIGAPANPEASPPLSKPRRQATAATISGKPTLSASVRCAV
jgi:superoxide dismutase, Fe-Mn family